MLHIPGLYITETEERGRGVFSAHALETDDIVEFCPLILIPAKDLEKVHQTILHDYYFLYPDSQQEGMACIALGYGSLYNHSAQPNAIVDFDLDNQQIQIRCITNITAGAEILINYNGDEQEKGLWFKPK